MTLKPTDMLEIQSAIDEYESKFPRRPPPSAETALAWRLGKRRARRLLAGAGQSKPEPQPARRKQLKLRWPIRAAPKADPSDRFGSLERLVNGVLLVGGWSVFAVAVVLIFFFGAVVGGFK